jgi:hypothetical protein
MAGWLGTIVGTLGVHADTVRRAIEVERFQGTVARPRPTKLDLYLPCVRETDHMQ